MCTSCSHEAELHLTCLIYCEPGALSNELRDFERRRRIQLVYFPYDPDSKTRRITPEATPSEAQWQDLHSVSWKELKQLDVTWGDFSGSEYFSQILDILGHTNRRDALHLDSAYKHGCRAFVTRDKGILDHRDALQELLELRLFHPDSDRDALRGFLDATCGAA